MIELRWVMWSFYFPHGKNMSAFCILNAEIIEIIVVCTLNSSPKCIVWVHVRLVGRIANVVATNSTLMTLLECIIWIELVV